jgi:hypothetical protein
MPVILALGRVRQEDLKLEACLSYIEFKSNLPYTERPCLKKKK